MKRLAAFAAEYEEESLKAIIGLSAKTAESKRQQKKKELAALTARDKELDMLFEILYEDNISGKINDARFSKMSKRYEEEQGETQKKLKLLRQELKNFESRHVDVDDFLQSIRRYRNVTEITPRMVRADRPH